MVVELVTDFVIKQMKKIIIITYEGDMRSTEYGWKWKQEQREKLKWKKQTNTNRRLIQKIKQNTHTQNRPKIGTWKQKYTYWIVQQKDCKKWRMGIQKWRRNKRRNNKHMRNKKKTGYEMKYCEKSATGFHCNKTRIPLFFTAVSHWNYSKAIFISNTPHTFFFFESWYSITNTLLHCIQNLRIFS